MSRWCSPGTQARDLAEQYSIELRITTNVQFLDAKMFDELKDITEALFLSIDSHNKEIFDKIRPGGKPDVIFENLETAAQLCQGTWHRMPGFDRLHDAERADVAGDDRATSQTSVFRA